MLLLYNLFTLVYYTQYLLTDAEFGELSRDCGAIPHATFSQSRYKLSIRCQKVIYIVTDLVNTLPDNSFLNTAQHATIEEAVFSADPTDAPIDWLDSEHVICLL
jgi:hypothetical protein